MIDQGKHDILGVEIDAIDYEGAVSRVFQAAETRTPMAVSALAVHGLMTGVLDATHRFRLNAFDLLCPDGQPVRWALNRLYKAGLSDRVYGPNLMLRICERAAEDGTPIFLFGGSKDLLSRLQSSLIEQYPKLKIAGVKASQFRTINDEEKQALVREIRDSGAKITFVGLGCPRQEVFAYEMRERLSMPLIAVGAAFNFHAGLLDQAPQWLQDNGLEWAYRFMKEPRRLWKRYGLLNPLYVFLIILQLCGIYRVGKLGSPPQTEISYG